MVWNAKQWKEQFELLTTQRNSNQKSEAMFLLRNMRADVFKHTLFWYNKDIIMQRTVKRLISQTPNP